MDFCAQQCRWVIQVTLQNMWFLHFWSCDLNWPKCPIACHSSYWSQHEIDICGTDQKKKGLLWPLSSFLCNNNSKGWLLENTFVFLLGSWNFVWFHIFFSLKSIIFSISVIAFNIKSTCSQEWGCISLLSVSSALIPLLYCDFCWFGYSEIPVFLLHRKIILWLLILINVINSRYITLPSAHCTMQLQP